jgi:adenylate kinase
MLNIIISGAPGCGKGTQSTLIIDKYRLKHFSTGDLLRKEIEARTALGLQAQDYISKGNLVPDDMIINIITHAINNLEPCCCGIIFDGFPRTVAQAEALESLMDSLNNPIDFLIDLQVPERELISRLLIRGETSGRSDDNLETIMKRLEVYKTKTTPVFDYYKKLGKYVAVEGTGSIDAIFGRISEALDKKKT